MLYQVSVVLPRPFRAGICWHFLYIDTVSYTHLIADMKTGNYENALIHFETRIGSPMLSDVIRGLIGVLRGDDQRMYFKMICFDMRQIEQNNLKKEAAKRPKKIQRYSMMMLICIMIIYLVVLCTEVMSSLGAFFG